MLKRKKGLILAIILLCAIIYTTRDLPVYVLLNEGPAWVYFVITGTLLSGYLATSYTLEDKKIDQQFIEKEGQVYMERIEEKRNRKV